MKYIENVRYIALSLALILSITGCKKEDSNLEKLYSRNLVLQQVEEGEMRAVLNSIARATNTSAKDVQKDLDGNNMFLYSNDDVVVLVQRKFDEPCGEQGCPWEVGISATDTTLPEASQKEVVDEAFTSIARAAEIQSHLNVESRFR
jgi:hypothetical protein